MMIFWISRLSYLLHKASSPFVLFRLEVLPLRLYLAVQLQLRITFGILEA